MLFIPLKSLGCLLRQPFVHAAILEHSHGRELSVEVISHNLKPARYKALTHYVQILAEWIDNPYAVLRRESLKRRIVVRLGKGIIHDFHKPVSSQEVGNTVTNSFRLRLRSGVDRHLHVLRKRYIVVPIDTKQFLHHVTLPADIHHICRSGYDSTPITPIHKLIVKILKNFFYGIMTYLAPRKLFDTVVIKIYPLTLNRRRITLPDCPDNFPAGTLLNKSNGPFERVDTNLRITSSLISERCVGLECLALGCLTH